MSDKRMGDDLVTATSVGVTRSTVSRKQFIAGAAGTGVVLAGSSWLRQASAAPRREARPLSPHQTNTLVAWCDLLVPGANENHVGQFVNEQLALPHEQAKLMLRYTSWPPPYEPFYIGGITALDEASGQLFEGRRFFQLDTGEQAEVRDQVLAGTVPWEGPPAQLFYFVTRGDGVDVVFGTKEGFDRLDFPYNALVKPRRPW